MSDNKVYVYHNLVFELTGFSAKRIAAYKPGDSVLSDSYKINVDGKSTQWYIELYPNGETAEEKGYMSLFLFRQKKDPKGLEAIFQFGIHNKSNVVFYGGELWSNFDNTEGFGSDKWISHSELFDRQNEYIADGQLTIICELAISTIVSVSRKPVTEDLKLFLTGTPRMFMKEELKDCELFMSDRKFLTCHKCVLAAHSDVFDKMFSVEMAEVHKCFVEIRDIDSQTMSQLLRFCYDLDVEDLDGIAHKLVFAADKYKIEELKKLCLDSLSETTHFKNVFRSLQITEKVFGSTHLYERCLNIIVIYYHDLIETEEWKNLAPQTVSALLHHVMLRYKSCSKASSTKAI